MSYFRNPDIEPLTEKEKKTIEKIYECLDDVQVLEVETPWLMGREKESDKLYNITIWITGSLDTRKLTKHFDILRIDRLEDDEIGLIVTPKENNNVFLFPLTPSGFVRGF